MIIAEIAIPQMFTAYAEHIGYVQNGLNHKQYFCEGCDQAFASAWGVTPGMNGYERGTSFHCTYCGKQHNKYVAYIKRHEACPNKVRLSLKTFKNLVILEVHYEAVYFDDVFGVRAAKGRESFRFDIAKQSVTFIRYGRGGSKVGTSDIGSPFDLALFNESILRFFTDHSLAVKKQRAELVKLLKLLRETIQSMMEKCLGHKLDSTLFVSAGTLRGMFLVPILNIAFRVNFPDAPNLPTVYRERVAEIETMWSRHMISEYGFMNDVIAQARKGTDFITAIIKAKKMPNSAAVRREIRRDFFECGRLATTFDLIKNYDYALRLYMGIKQILSRSQGSSNIKNLIKFLHGVLANYGESGLATLVENDEEMDIDDCARLYDQLNKESREDLRSESVRLRDLHDWMAKKHRKQGHKNLILDVPDHIIKRLSMQRDKISFFLPKESRELLEAGEELHNCVASYSAAMQDHRKWIVLVANDKGKLAACLEVVETTLVQAKLVNNQRVAKDDKLNAEVIAWAEKAKIDIKTNDVKIPIAEQVQSA